MRRVGIDVAHRRFKVGVSLIALLALIPGPAVAASPANDLGYGSTVVGDVAVAMDDGVTLVGDVIYPADRRTGERARGRFPVLLNQNPYRCQSSASNLEFWRNSHLGGGESFAEHGYVYVSFCVRGTGRSGGEFEFFSGRQQRDGVALVNWAVNRLSGGNRTVGLIGCSYSGYNQMLTVAALPPRSGVKAMMPACVGSEFYRGANSSGGVPTQTAVNYLSSIATTMDQRAAPWAAWMRQETDAGAEMAYENPWNMERTPGNWADDIVRADVPALLWSGYRDMSPATAQEMYVYLQNAYFGRRVFGAMRAGDPTTPRYQVIVGPNGHGEDVDREIALRWFDTWLKGARTGMERTATPMHLFRLPDDGWVNMSTPTPVRRATSYYLDQRGRLSTRAVPGRMDVIGYGAGALTYTSAPLRDGATLAGAISADLTASTTGTNLSLVATLADVAPDGTSTPITTGNVVGSLRALDNGRAWRDGLGTDLRPYGTFMADQPMQPGRPYRLEFPLSTRVAQIERGHAIRLTLTTQTTADCTSLVGNDPCYPTAPQRRTFPGTYRIDLGPSRINLPLAAYGCAATTGGTGSQPVHFEGPRNSCSRAW